MLFGCFGLLSRGFLTTAELQEGDERLLERKAFAAFATRQSCQHERTHELCRAWSLPLLTHDTIDAALVSVANMKYLHGAQQHMRSKLMGAFIDRFPQFSRFGAHHLPRFHRALVGQRLRTHVNSRRRVCRRYWGNTDIVTWPFSSCSQCQPV